MMTEVVFTPKYLLESGTIQDIKILIQITIIIKDTRIRETYSGRKLKATCYVLITGSPYCDAEGYPHH